MQTQSVAKSVPGSSAAIEVRSQAPFSVGVVLWRDEAGRVLATVVAKATYALEQGTAEMVELPDPIRHPDEYWDDGAAGSLRFPSDLAPFKAAHEVLIAGHVYANGSRPAHEATARIAVGDIEKMIAASAPRRFDRDGQLESGPPQTRFSLRYEFAPGGVDSDNPVGIDATALTPAGGRILPQLTPANLDVRPGDHVPLVGVGPVSRAWPPRDGLLRPKDREWLLDPVRRRRPQTFDARYFFTAPIDQRTAEPFRADERLILEGLHPTHPRLVTNLGGVAPALRSVGSRRSVPPFVADTLYIDTDRQIATLAFRAIVPLGDEKLVLDLVAERMGEGRVDEATTELEKSAFADAVSTGLPFPPSSESGSSLVRDARTQGNVEGLPFRPPSPSSPPVALAPPPPPSSPPLALTPPSPPAIVTAPPSVRSTIGQLLGQTPLTTEDRRAKESPKRTEAQQRNEARDAFRKAFGSGGGGEKPKAETSAGSAPTSVKTTAEAGPAPDGVKAASDAAAALAKETMLASDAALASETKLTSETPLERRRVTRRAIVDLVDFDPDVPNRLRRSKTHAPLLADFTPPRPPRKLDEPVAEPDRGRLEVLRVLSCATPLGPGDLHGAFDALLDDPHDFETPLLLVEGDIKPTMDEIETLRVATSLAKPLAGHDKRVLTALAIANEALAAPVPPPPETAVHLYKQLEASTRELSLPTRYFADLVERTLSDARSFKKRTLLGTLRIRAELSLGKITLPIYLPDAVATKLPLLPSFSAVALVELRPREDASEPNPDALVAFALGRVFRARK